MSRYYNDVNNIDPALVRKRQSYDYFGGLYDWFDQPRTPDECVKKVYEIIDKYRGFHSQYNSDCARESIGLLIMDKRHNG